MPVIDPEGFEDFFDAPPDYAREIGSEPGVTPAKVMRIGRLKPDGPLVYLGNVELKRLMAAPELLYHEIQGTPESVIRKGRHYWECPVFRVKRSEFGDIKVGHEIVRAKHHYSCTLVLRSRFKRGSRKGYPYLCLDRHLKLKGKTYKKVKYRKEEVLIFNSLIVMQEWLENRTYNPWDTADKFLTTGKWDYGFDMVLGNSIRSPNEYKWVYGLCEDFDDALEEVFRSPEIIELLLATNKNDVPFSYPMAYQGRRLTLQDDTITSSDYLVRLAIAQALAGPDPTHDEENWIGQPVYKSAKYLYCRHLDNMNERIVSDKSDEVPYREEYDFED